jgi:hypothetical protein
MKQYIITLHNDAESLTAKEVHALLTDDLDWRKRDVEVKEVEVKP